MLAMKPGMTSGMTANPTAMKSAGVILLWARGLDRRQCPLLEVQDVGVVICHQPLGCWALIPLVIPGFIASICHRNGYGAGVKVVHRVLVCRRIRIHQVDARGDG